MKRNNFYKIDLDNNNILALSNSINYLIEISNTDSKIDPDHLFSPYWLNKDQLVIFFETLEKDLKSKSLLSKLSLGTFYQKNEIAIAYVLNHIRTI